MEADGGGTGSSHGAGCVPLMLLLWTVGAKAWKHVTMETVRSPEVASVVRCSDLRSGPQQSDC